MLQKLESTHARHVYIKQAYIRIKIQEHFQPLFPILRAMNLSVLPLELQADSDGLQDAFVIVYYEELHMMLCPVRISPGQTNMALNLIISKWPQADACH